MSGYQQQGANPYATTHLTRLADGALLRHVNAGRNSAAEYAPVCRFVLRAMYIRLPHRAHRSAHIHLQQAHRTG